MSLPLPIDGSGACMLACMYAVAMVMSDLLAIKIFLASLNTLLSSKLKS